MKSSSSSRLTPSSSPPVRRLRDDNGDLGASDRDLRVGAALRPSVQGHRLDPRRLLQERHSGGAGPARRPVE